MENARFQTRRVWYNCQCFKNAGYWQDPGGDVIRDLIDLGPALAFEEIDRHT